MAGGPADLHALCREYLEACALAVASTPGGAIDRVFVSPGMPAFDCPEAQLTVHAGGPAQADTAPLAPPLQPGHRDDYSVVVNLVALTATVYRCAPVIAQVGDMFVFPEPSEMEAAAEFTNADVWAIWNVVRRRYRDGLLFTTPNGRKRALFFDPAVPLLTSGGTAGWQIQIRVQLDGYGGAT